MAAHIRGLEMTKYLAIALLLANSAMGATVISVTWNASSSGTAIGLAAVSWNQTGSWSNVAIGANLVGNGLVVSTATVYLMNQIGPGTTAANEVAPPVPISTAANPGLNVMLPLYSGLSLGPGTYYLVFAPDAGSVLGWDVTGNQQVLGPGVTQNTDQGSLTPDAFAPASAFSNASNSRIFSVTGTLGAAPGVPEPSTVIMLFAGLTGLAVKALRKRMI